MIILIYYKPDAIYDREKKEFRQFGIDDGKTLIPIYVVAILTAIVLYVIFNQIAKIMDKTNKTDNDKTDSQLLPYTDRDSDISSLKNQMAIMNQNLVQLNQQNMMNQNMMSQNMMSQNLSTANMMNQMRMK